MKDIKRKERTVSIIMAVLISLVMDIIAPLFVRRGMSEEALEHSPAAIMYALNILESIVVGVLTVLFLPLGRLGMALATKAGATPPGIRFTLLNSIPLAVGSSLIVSLVVSLINVIQARARIPGDMPPFIPMWLSSWAPLVIPSIIISYVLAVLISPLVVRAVGLGGPPKDT